MRDRSLLQAMYLSRFCAGNVIIRSGNLVTSSMDVYNRNIQLADSKIRILTEKVAQLKQLEVSKAVEKEKLRLATENSKLQNEIDDLKTRLSIAELQNGKPQYSIPSVIACAKNVEKPQSPAKHDTATDKAESKTEKSPKQQKPKTEKPKKKSTPEAPKSESPVDITRIDLRIGRIVKAEKHPDADSLYIEEVETGEEKNRTVISGLVKFIPVEEMQNRMVVLMMNLKPVKMRGIFSQAMVMCASSPEKVEILTPPPGCVPGDVVTFDGYEGEPDKQLNPKKKVWEQVQPDLKTDDKKVACYKGVPFTVKGKGIVTSQTMANSMIK